MNLRSKLLVSFLIFVVALIALGGFSTWGLREMGGVSRRIISNDSVLKRENTASMWVTWCGTTATRFWQTFRPAVLATYLWNDGRFPDERLAISDLTPEELDIAARWERDE